MPDRYIQWLAEEERKRKRMVDEKLKRRAARVKDTSGSSLGLMVSAC